MYYRMSADNGFEPAQFKLARIYELGQMVPKDLKEALRLYELAATAGDTEAEFKAGLMNYLGRALKKIT